MKLYKKCWNEKYEEWDTTNMTPEEKNVDYNGDGKVSDREKLRAKQTWVRKEMHKKLQSGIRNKMEELNIAQVEESYGEDDTPEVTV